MPTSRAKEDLLPYEVRALHILRTEVGASHLPTSFGGCSVLCAEKARNRWEAPTDLLWRAVGCRASSPPSFSREEVGKCLLPYEVGALHGGDTEVGTGITNQSSFAGYRYKKTLYISKICIKFLYTDTLQSCFDW